MHVKRAQVPLVPKALMFRLRGARIAMARKRSVQKNSHRFQWVLALLAAIAAGCTTTGTGVGSTASGGSPTTFSWKSSDGTSGSMTAAMTGGQTYSGQYFQSTKDTPV